MKKSHFTNNFSDFIWGTSIQQRKKQQDCRSVDFLTLENGEHITVVGVYDGHGNTDIASMYCSEFFPTQIKNAVEHSLACYEQVGEKTRELLDELIAVNIRDAFLLLDQNYGVLEGSTCTRSGSTCCVCLEFRGKFYFINIGDSRAIGGFLPFYNVVEGKIRENSNGQNKLHIAPDSISSFEQLTIDHCAATNEYEIERVKSNGAILSGARMFPEKCLSWWSFMLTRSFGNTFAKGNCMIADPDIYIKAIENINNVYNPYPYLATEQNDKLIRLVTAENADRLKYIESLIGRHQNIISTLHSINMSTKDLVNKQNTITKQFELAKMGKVTINTQQKNKYIQKLEILTKQLGGLEQTRVNLETVFYKVAEELKAESQKYDLDTSKKIDLPTTNCPLVPIDEIREFKALKGNSEQNLNYSSDLSNGGDSLPFWKQENLDPADENENKPKKVPGEAIMTLDRTSNGILTSEEENKYGESASYSSLSPEANPKLISKFMNAKKKEQEERSAPIIYASYYQETNNNIKNYVKDIGGESLFYNLDHGSIDNYKIPSVDYVVLASDGVWSPLKNIEVHEIVDNSYYRFFETGDIRYINPCNIAISIGIRVMQVVSSGNLHKDDITVIVGIRKKLLERQCEALRIPMQTQIQVTLNYNEIIGNLDIWYDNLRRLLLDYYKKTVQLQSREPMFVKLMGFLQGSLDYGLEDPSNQMRFFVEVDRLIKKHHEKYVDMKQHGSAIFQVKTYSY